jgi:hypothetical protein
LSRFFRSPVLYFRENTIPMENPAIVYLYLYLAIADKDFSEQEASIILSKLKKNPAFTGMDASNFIDEIYQNFLRLPIDSVMVYLENYMVDMQLTDTDRTRVIEDLEEIMEADGVIRKEEMLAFQRIKKYLSYGSNYPLRASA